MKILKIGLLSVASVFVLFVAIPKYASADATATPVNINFEVVGATSTIFSQNIAVPDCTTPNNASSTINGFCAFAAAGLTVDASSVPSGVQINSIGGIAGNWQWSLNGSNQTSSIDAYVPQTNDTVIWSLPTPPAEHITVTIRDNSTTAFSGTVILPSTSTPDILVLPTNGTTTIAVSPRSVLGVLENLQASTSSFSITDLSYYSSYNSFLLNCIVVPAATSTPACYNWTDAVNGSFPQAGMDKQQLKDGDVVYLFFGSSHKTELSTNSVVSGQPFTATAEQYNLASGNYVPLTGVTLGVGIQNPDYSFTELATSTVDGSGQTAFTLNTTGTFAVGIKDDFYFPSVSINITASTSTPPSGGGGGGGVVHVKFNVPKGLAFISSNQNSDGSFSSPYSTDWTALAFASVDTGAAKLKLKSYLLNTTPTLSGVTDYERHAMALEAFGINPYSGTGVDYISPIVKAFDGTQIGDSNLDGDDVFAIFPLTNAGYTAADPIIQKTIAHIISTQKPDGSWDESPDMTAAAIQAIGPFFLTPGYVKATGMAFGYLASTQKADGGWGNIDSTSWVDTMLNALKEGDPAHFVPIISTAGFFPEDYIGAAQQTDGGVTSADRVWSTSYAVTAASGIDWLDLLQSFPKPAVSGSGGGSAVLGTTTSTIPTLVTPSPTTTPENATTTVPIIENLIVIQPTTTPVVAIKPILKIHKTVLKGKNIKPVPIILGEATTEPAAPQQNVQTTPPQNSNNPGFLGKIWHAISGFFGRLF